jgi:hypothetical protein
VANGTKQDLDENRVVAFPTVMLFLEEPTCRVWELIFDVLKAPAIIFPVANPLLFLLKMAALLLPQPF